MGMFAGRNSLSAAQQVARGGDGVDPMTARAGFFDQGGIGRPIAGYIGDALLNLSGGKPVYAPAMLEQQQQAAQYRRQLAIAQWKSQHPDPTALQQNYEYLKGIDPAKGESYLNAQANPQTLMTDPATGQVMFAPKGGVPGMNMGGALPDSGIPTVNDAASFNAIPKGAQFRDPQGNIRVKP